MIERNDTMLSGYEGIRTQILSDFRSLARIVKILWSHTCAFNPINLAAGTVVNPQPLRLEQASNEEIVCDVKAEKQESPEIFITAAPIGGVPRYLNPAEPKYISEVLAHTNIQLQTALEKNKGWEKSPAGGLVISESTEISLDSKFIQTAFTTSDVNQLSQDTGFFEELGVLRIHAVSSPPSRNLAASWFSKIRSQRLVTKLVLHLTTQGWKGDNNGGLVWHHDGMESYIPPELVQTLRSDNEELVQDLQLAGWKIAGPGFSQHSRGASPYLPITPTAIITESAAAAEAGAAIVHLHTRDRSDEITHTLPWSSVPIVLGSQANKIVPEDYDIIVPALKRLIPSTILNLSTSMRGGVDSESPIRRAHLKTYSPDSRAPDICTLSPAEVLFQNGGGYDNSPAYLEKQITRCRTLKVRPEIEVFNWTILRETIGNFKATLVGTGTPPLLMLVAGVDQHRRIEGGGLEDDSLVPVPKRKQIYSLLQAGKEEDLKKALDLAAGALQPVVDEIRIGIPEAKISILMPGPMQLLLARLSVKLRLDGVRIGLEDALSVCDLSVPGGVRKGSTSEQVRGLRDELLALGCKILTAEETRCLLDMPTSPEGFASKEETLDLESEAF